MNDRQIDAASYLYLNYHVFKDVVISLVRNIDAGYIFEIPKSDQVLKLLKMLAECDYIKEYKEVKNTDLVVGIFTNKNTYHWIVDYLWIGLYLTYFFETNPAYFNLKMKNDNCQFIIHLILEIGNMVIISTGEINVEDPRANVSIIDINQLGEHLSMLSTDSFTIPINEIKTRIESIIEGIR